MSECKEGIEDDSRDSGMKYWKNNGAIYQRNRNDGGGWGDRSRQQR